MKITCYLQARRIQEDLTGVGRHIQRVLEGLSARPGIDLSLLASIKDLPLGGRLPGSNPLTATPTKTYGSARGVMERVWYLTGRPRADRWAADADWLYCPTEVYVPAKRPRTAVTVHDVALIEDSTAWHGAVAGRPNRAWQRKLSAIVRHSDLLLTVSEFTKSRLIALLNADADRIRVIGNGVDDRFFDAAPPPHGLPLAAGDYVLAVGGATPRKGGTDLLALARSLLDAGSKLKVVIAGKSTDPFLEQSKALPNVVQLGYVPDTGLPALLRDAVALIFLSNYEGFGIPVLEAMAAGTPAVVANRTSLPEIAGDAGFVVDVADMPAVVTLIDRLANDSAFRADAVVRGRHRAAGFTWAACADKLVDALTDFGRR